MRPAKLLVLALALAASACKREAPAPAAAVAVEARVRIAPVAVDHPWVIALLTEAAVARPPGVEARLEGRREVDGRSFPEPLLEADERGALERFIAAHEAVHPRPPELAAVWEHEPHGHGHSPRWRVHFIDQAAGFEIDDDATAIIEAESFGPSVHLRLGPAQGERLAELTRAHVGERVAIVIDDDAIMVPVIRAPIPGGELQLLADPGRDPEVTAPALLDRLAGR